MIMQAKIDFAMFFNIVVILKSILACRITRIPVWLGTSRTPLGGIRVGGAISLSCALCFIVLRGVLGSPQVAYQSAVEVMTMGNQVTLG